jgi:hypothetical protein
MILYVQGGAINCERNCFFFMYWSLSLIDAEKGWLVNIGLLVAHQFNVGAIFHHDSLQAVVG